MTTATLDTIPGTVTTILDMRRGQCAEIMAILGRPEAHWGLTPPVEPGMVVHCIEHDEDGTTLEDADGRLLHVPRELAGCIQVERCRGRRKPPRWLLH